MGQRLGDLRARQAVLHTTLQIGIEQIVVPHRRQRSDGDEAAVARRKIGPPPQIIEHHLIGQLRKLGSERPELACGRLTAAWLGCGG